MEVRGIVRPLEPVRRQRKLDLKRRRGHDRTDRDQCRHQLVARRSLRRRQLAGSAAHRAAAVVGCPEPRTCALRFGAAPDGFERESQSDPVANRDEQREPGGDEEPSMESADHETIVALFNSLT